MNPFQESYLMITAVEVVTMCILLWLWLWWRRAEGTC